ncbi:MAG: DEAD/DEAH box helicase [Levilactobacillus sp.]|jgi:superfamily II DNA/RNA helicase|uniref:DEAD/DEAH box helicase n=1 Tax=Levilactobacillus sp. TaxID=2767919 RepID=UPI00258A51DD|nr:DEAD/DEAH box helicase [Levilactobacillus sp.]MCH4123885.1 DEAD/DEAH box helicase [Levilactobacillus sp.]MCI1553983.1 DEAD/DEAH box helicase [Levilactobacillus sp.]MCI1606921.1 DEAD/DEAH box helicase [Levilactobacillus sp.]
MLKQFEKHFTELGYQAPTAIQTAVYDAMVGDQNVLGLAPTGSGKTVAFTLPALANLLPGDGTQLIVLEPSQELAIQTSRVMRDWGKLLDLKVVALTGGANVKRQTERLKKRPEIVVGTPGRVLNLVNDRKLKLHLVSMLIVDEADDLLTGDTLDTVREIAQSTPADVQLGFFSATDTPILHELDKWFGQTVERIDVREQDKTQGVVRHGLLQVGMNKRDQMLKRLLAMPNFRALVFFKQASTLRKTATRFYHDHVSAAGLTSDLRQVQREKALQDFRQGRIRLLLTTDVAARGLDIPKLPAVINYDLPDKVNEYVHRVGRTGRMGEPGQVISLGDDHDLRDLKRLLKDTDYDLVPLYFSGRGLTTERPTAATVKANETAKAVRTTTTATTKPQPGATAAPKSGTQASVKATAKAEKPNPSKKKKHKNRHTKNKGMRKKWRDRDAQN